MSTSRPHVFVRDEVVYSSPNIAYLPEVPSFGDRFSVEVHHPREAQKLRWWSDTSPHLTLIPKIITFDNPIFQRLCWTYRNIPIVQDGSWYYLSPDVREQWIRLETALRWVADTIFSSSKVLVPLGFEPGPLPSSCGYTNKHTEERFARGSAMKSRDAFVPLMALCTFAIIITRPGRNVADDRWVKLLQERNVHASWLEDLIHSPVADFSVDRIGAFVNATSEFEFSYLIKPLLQANVPIWIAWGNLKKPPQPNQVPTILHPFKPNDPEVQAAMSPAVKKPNPLTAPLPHGSRQQPGETWQAYFNRVSVERSAYISRESLAQRGKRLDREQQNSSFRMPSKKGATVFHWNEDLNTFRIRTRVARKDVEEFWGKYADSQKRYDSLKDEWDVCTEFDPNGVGDDYLEEDEDLQDVIGRFPPINIDIPDARTWEEVNVDYRPEESLTQVGEFPDDKLDDIMHFRYGLSVSPAPYQGIKAGARVEPSEARKLVGEMHSDLREQRMIEPISDLVQCIIAFKKNNTIAIPSTLWDLDINNFHYLFARKDLVTFAEPIQTRSQLPLFVIKTNKLHATRNTEWKIVLEDPATALECLRRGWGPHYTDIAEELCARGYPFSTRISGPAPSNPSTHRPLPAITGLGYRLPGYKPRNCDYAVYEAIRNQLLATPRARAALLKGGIVWRLAKEGMSELSATGGPSVEVYTTGTAFAVGNQYLWDDNLTDDEIDIICGVYKVFTGIGMQDSHQSWWPKPNAWNKCTHNIGYWTEACEDWFQTRLRKIRSGQGELRSGQHWTQSLGFDHTAKKLTDANRLLAGKVLLRQMSR